MTVASQVKQTLTSLKSAQSTLRIYSSQTQEKETIAAYKETMDVTNGIISDLEQRIKTLEFQEPQYKGN
jgi:exo-beta-1,3-glucanase (GH17 family)